MSFAPKQFIRSVDFLSTENAINTSTGCVNIYGGMSVSKDSYLTNMIVVGNSTVANLNITGTLRTSTGNALISSQWTSIDANTDIYFGTSANAFVGIGTTTPGFNLDISGGSRITEGLTVGSLNVNTGATITNILNTTICTGTVLVSTGITTSNIRATSNVSANQSTITTMSGSTLQLSTGITTPSLRVSGTINSGDVTVGNINFTGSLFQNGTAYLGSQWTTTAGNTLTYTSGNVSINSGFTSTFNSNTLGNIFTTGGNVGINTTSPSRLLHLRGDALRIDRDSNSSSFFLVRTAVSDYSTLWKGYQFGVNANGVTDGSFFISDLGAAASGGGTQRLLIDNNGNIGIGTTNPSTTLDVSGTGRITTSLTTGALFSTNLTTTNIVGTSISTGTLNASTIATALLTASTSITTGTLFSTNQTSTNIVGTAISTGTLNASTIATALLTASTSITTGTLFSTNQTTTNIVSTSISSGTLNSQTLSLTETATFRQYFNASSNDTIVITIPYTKPNVWHSLQLEVIINGIAPNITAGLLGNYLFRGEVWNATQDLRIVRKHSREACVIYAYFSATSSTAGNLIIKINGNDGFTQNANLGILVLINSNSSSFVFNRGSVTTEVSTISDSPYEINMSTMFSSNVGIGTTTATPSAVLHVQGDAIITTSLTTGSLFSTNLTTTNIAGTNVTVTNMNSSTNTIGTLNATGITTASLLATSASIGNISAGTINLSGNMNVAGTLTVVNVTTTNLTMSNGNALLNLVTSGTILNTGTITSGPLTLRTPNNYDGRILTLSTLTVGNAYNLTFDAVTNTTNNVYWSLGQNTLSSTYANMLTFYGGNVGINTTQASSKFVVADSGATKGHLKLVSNTGATEDNWWLGFCHVDSSDSNDRARIGVKIQGGGAGRLFFTTGGFGSQVERMTIGASGNVGIGTTSANASLELFSSVQSQPRLILSGQEFYQASTSSTSGIALLAGVNRTGNRQLWVADSANLTQNSTNSVIRIAATGTTIDAVSTDGLTVLPLTIGNAGNVVNIANLTSNNLSSTNQTTTNIVGTNVTISNIRLTSTTNIFNTVTNFSTTSGALNILGDVVIDGNELYFTTTGVNPPTMNGRSAGSKLILYPETNTTKGDYSIGIESAHMWFQVPNINYAGYKFYQGTTTSLIITPAGNVGIGTTGPSRMLSLSGPVSNIVNGPHIWINTSDSPVNPVFQQLNWSTDNVSLNFDMYYDGSFRNSGSSVAWQIYKSNSQLRFMLQNGTAGSSNGQFNAMVLGSTGNVGIGNPSTPAYILDVAGTTRITNTSATSMGTLIVAGPGSTGYVPSTATSGQLASFYGPGGAGIFSNVDFSTYTPASNTLPSVRFSMKDLGSANSDFNILTRNSGAGGTMASRIFIDGSGNIGINTTNPGVRLDINAGAATNAQFRVNSSGADSTLSLNNTGSGGREYWIGSASSGAGAGSGNLYVYDATALALRMVIGSSGNLGVATSAPSGRLHTVMGDTTAAASPSFWDSTYAVFGQAGNTGGAVGLGYSSASGGCLLSLSPNVAWQPMTYRGSNHQFIVSGTIGTSPTLSVNSTQVVAYTNTNGEGLLKIGNTNTGSSAYSILRIGNNVNDAVMFLNSSTRTIDGGINTFTIRNDAGALRLQGTGATNTIFLPGNSTNVGINTTAPSYTLQVAGDIYATGDVISFSDARLKTDVETITDALDKVSNMRGVYYTNLNTQTRETGVIAQEISEILPEVVADKGEYLGVAYGNIVGVLIEAIKELKARVAELENR